MKRWFVLMIALALLAGCNAKDSENKNDDITEDDSVSFRNVDVNVENGNVVMVGEANAASNKFYVKLVQNEKTFVDEEGKELDENLEWQEFTIEMKLPDSLKQGKEPPVLLLYGKNDEGETVNPNYFPLDLES